MNTQPDTTPSVHTEAAPAPATMVAPKADAAPAAVAKKRRSAKPTATPAAPKSVAAKPATTKPAVAKHAVAKPATVKTAAVKPLKAIKAVKAVKAIAPKPAPQALPAPVPATASVPAAAAPKPVRAKEKLVRDSFTMPRAEFALIHELKERALGFKRATKKSELLRAGLQVLAALDDSALKTVLNLLPALKAGRPRKGN